MRLNQPLDDGTFGLIAAGVSKTIRTVMVLSMLFSAFYVPRTAHSAAINTDVALPIRQGGFIFRTQIKWTRAGGAGEENVVVVPLVLAYGATPDLALFVIAPYLYRNQEFADLDSGKKIEKNDHGIGDLTLLGRYTVYKRDYPAGTARWALLGGIKLPTGDGDLEPLTTDSVDFHLGGVTTITWGFGRHEVDADLIYEFNTEAGGFEKGDELRADLAYLFRIYPWVLPDSGAPGFIYLVIEANGIFAQKSEIDGRSIGSTGGLTLFLSPGLQYASKLFMIELSVQLPVVQELNGAQLEKDFVITTGIRINIP